MGLVVVGDVLVTLVDLVNENHVLVEVQRVKSLALEDLQPLQHVRNSDNELLALGSVTDFENVEIVSFHSTQFLFGILSQVAHLEEFFRVHGSVPLDLAKGLKTFQIRNHQTGSSLLSETV